MLHRHMLPPYGKRVYSSERSGRRGGSAGRGRWSCQEGGEELEGEDVASKLEGVDCVGADYA